MQPPLPPIPRHRVVFAVVLALAGATVGFGLSHRQMQEKQAEQQVQSATETTDDTSETSLPPASPFASLTFKRAQIPKTYIPFAADSRRKAISTQADHNFKGSELHALADFCSALEKKAEQVSQRNEHQSPAPVPKKTDSPQMPKATASHPADNLPPKPLTQPRGQEPHEELDCVELPEQQPEEDAPQQLAYPNTASRPPLTDLVQAWNHTSNTRQCFVDSDRRSVCQGFQIAPNLLVSVEPFSPCSLDRLHSVIDEIASLRLCRHKSQNTAILSPYPPQNGEEVILCDGSAAKQHFVKGKIISAYDDGTFTLLAPCEWASRGSAILNKRGEVLGILTFASPESAGSSCHPALDSSVLNELTKPSPSAELLRSLPGPQDVIDHDLENRLNRLLAAHPLPSNPFASHNTRIIPGLALGNFYLGMQAQDIMDNLGEPQDNAVVDDMIDCWVYSTYNLSFYLLRDRVIMLEAGNRSYATAKGVGPGVTWNDTRGDDLLRQGYQGNLRGFKVLAAQGLEIIMDKSETIVSVRVTLP